MSRPRLASPRAALAVSAGLAVALGAVGCASTPTPEIGEGPCSNGIDDDGDRLVDCEDPACALFSWCAASPDAAAPDASTPLDAGDVGPLACAEPLDLVLVLDVSSSMTDDVAHLRDLAPSLFELARAASPEARLSLVVFVDDALAVDDCAPFADAASLAAALDQWRAFTATNLSPVSEIRNVDCVENSLDAIGTAITSCPWRSGGSRVILHVTDDTFAERPAVLSGPFGPGVLVASTYPEVSDALARQDVTLLALTRSGMGADCGGPRISADVGRGFSSPYGTDPSLPERTGGEAWDLLAFRDGTFALPPALEAFLARTVCVP